ncbi:two-component sensor histidine kinase [Nocardiopsis sp. TSRI0078]|uniref:MtrAB system histidine kinase MtrB n=1 Tax=unclassified Nocardiopsis TaxID=2649073 RepID=UPI000939D815|nr:MtrAB system histidine kinase MtrB [Nocardiopsis sp. TSRI0078]OKI15099.1 two-component sensor histidine kinase [Nocardiopsis sp. TSRI0078]
MTAGTPEEERTTASEGQRSGASSGPPETGGRWRDSGTGLTRAYLFAQRAARALVRGVHTNWRRSLHLRVISTTLVLSLVVMAGLGYVLISQVRSGLLDAKIATAATDHRAGLGYALTELQENETADRKRLLYDLANELTSRSGDTGLYSVVILPSVGDEIGWATGEGSVPKRLIDQVRRSEVDDQQYHTYTRITTEDGGTEEPALVVGSQLTHAYELYYLFPLQHEQEILDLVQNTVALVGILLVILLGLIAFVITRQVVTPVRSAAQSAERLSSGDLTERMTVQGEDDLARLALSFNDMAGNLQEKIQELEELSKLQRQFVSDVSHELRTPLTTIKMAGDVLFDEREELDPTMRRSVELLQGQVERFEELLADLLEISRHDAGAVTLGIESLDIRDAVMKAVGDAEQIAERRGIKVILRLPAEPCTAEYDARRINRILRNLVVNAIEHSEGRDVVVTAAGDRDAVAVAVRDYGVGLKEGEEHLCFDRFWRADPARVRTTGGTGLGLSIAKEDAMLHGGWLQAWGMPGQGSQFRLSLPRRSGAELRGSPLPLVPPEIALGRSFAPFAGEGGNGAARAERVPSRGDQGATDSGDRGADQREDEENLS